MKIKTKKQLNLPQLIEWAMKNDMHERSFCGDRYGDAVHFDENEDMLCDHVSLTETFTVEVEEEITEDTVLPKLVKHTCNSYYEHRDKSINMLDRAKEWSTFYYKDDNENMHLIWRNGKLVE